MWPHVPLVLKQLHQEYLPVVSMSDIRARHLLLTRLATVESMFKNLPSTPTYISFPELKEAYILLAIITNKLSSKFTSIHITFLSYISGYVGCSWSAWRSFLISYHFTASAQMEQNDMGIVHAVEGTPGSEHKRMHYARLDAYRFCGYILGVPKRNSSHLITTFCIIKFSITNNYFPDCRKPLALSGKYFWSIYFFAFHWTNFTLQWWTGKC